MRLRAGTVDAVFDEGLPLWFEDALAAGMRPITLDDLALRIFKSSRLAASYDSPGPV